MNPYYKLIPLEKKDMFFGRINLMKAIYFALSKRQCFSFVGFRRIGKSSILKCLALTKMQEKFGYDGSLDIFVYINLELHTKRGPEEFFDLMNETIITECHKRLEIQIPTKRGSDAFAHLLDQIQEKGFHLVILMDNFESTARNIYFDVDFFSFLQAYASMEKVSYVIASNISPEEEKVTAINHASFFDIFDRGEAGPLTQNEARDLVTIPSSREGCPFTDNEVNWVLELAGCHPLFIQRVCFFLFEEKSQSRSLEVNKEQRERIKKIASKDLSNRFDTIWENLNTNDRELLKDEARREKIQFRVRTELSGSAIFRQFVRDKFQLQISHVLEKEKLEKEVRGALKCINNPEFLGKSELRHLEIVSDRLKNGSTASTVEIGMAVREVLNEAFERMCGPGKRSDSAMAWRFYNILYYKYFKFHLQQKQINARLESASKRKFFYDLDRAIRMLCDIIIEREKAFIRQDY